MKKRSWKFWTLRSVLLLLLLGVLWLVNLIWFRPFNITHFYERVFVEFVLESPELTTSMGIPVLHDLSKDELDDLSAEQEDKYYRKIEDDYQTLMRYDF